jgi:hypothetical protein
MKRWDILNLLVKRFNYKSYLEIGLQDPNSNFVKIDVDYKISVDPNPQGECTFIGTSDEYFESITDDTKFDLIFIDGLHHYDQVLKDIENSLKHLNEGGTIIVHDCLPTTERMQERDDHGGEWTGDVWKAISILRMERIDLSIYTINTDYGCGIIKRGTNIPYENVELNYNYYDENKYKLLNVIEIKDFYSILFNV